MITAFCAAQVPHADWTRLGLVPPADGRTAAGHWAVPPDTPLTAVHRRLCEHGRIPDVIARGDTLLMADARAIAVSLDGRFTAIVSGVVSNRDELLSSLSARLPRSSALDPAICAEGWAQWGDGLAERIRGAALVIVHDALSGRLNLVTDRYGERAVYAARPPGGIVVASDIKPLLVWPGMRVEADMLAVNDFLQMRYAMPPMTAFQGVERVMSAEVTAFEAGREVAHRRYWRRAPQDRTRPISGRALEDAAAEVLEKFDDAVRVLAESDLRVGCLLSGGVDSGAITARLAGMRREPVPTFVAAFAQEGFNEVELAQLAADKYGTDHHVHLMGPELIDRLGDLIWHYSVPFSDSSSLVTTGVMKAAREKVDVVLGGDGAEQVFIGAARYINTAHTIAAFERGELLPDVFLAPTAAHGPARVRDVLMRNVGVFRANHKREGYGDALMPYVLAPSADRLGEGLENVPSDLMMDAAAERETRGLLMAEFLIKNTVAAGYADIDVRMPFLDHRLSDAVTALPHELRVFERFGHLRAKGLLKFMFEGRLDDRVLYGANLGFGVPLRHWFRNELKDFLVETLTSRRFVERELFTPAYVDRLIDEHLGERRDHAARLWTLLTLELWMQTFIDRPPDCPLTLDPRRVG